MFFRGPAGWGRVSFFRGGGWLGPCKYFFAGGAVLVFFGGAGRREPCYYYLFEINHFRSIINFPISESGIRKNKCSQNTFSFIIRNPAPAPF